VSCVCQRGPRQRGRRAGREETITVQRDARGLKTYNIADDTTVGDAKSLHLALAWELAQSPVVIPIPGARRAASITNSATAATIQLTEEPLARLDKVT
jgi:aryl-alcohol dehydrogenase-like predicted oxidoreductase